MEVLFILMLLGFGGLLIASPIMAIVALVKISDLRSDLAHASRLLRDLQGRISGAAPPPPESRPATSPAPPPTPERAAPPPRTVAEPPQPAPPPEPPAPPTPAAEAAKKEGLEERLAPLLLPGLGAIAVVLAVVFLVRHAIEMDWLGPAVQCMLGSGIGIALIGGGELLRRHPFERLSVLGRLNSNELHS